MGGEAEAVVQPCINYVTVVGFMKLNKGFARASRFQRSQSHLQDNVFVPAYHLSLVVHTV
jgi:hypothetical protein